MVLTALDKVLVVAPDKIEEVLRLARTPVVASATRILSESVPDSNPSIARVFVAEVVNAVGNVNAPPSVTSFPVKVNPLEAVVLSGPSFKVTGAPASPLTIVTKSLVAGSYVFDTLLMIGAVATTPFVVLVKVLTVLDRVLVVTPEIIFVILSLIVVLFKLLAMYVFKANVSTSMVLSFSAAPLPLMTLINRPSIVFLPVKVPDEKLLIMTFEILSFIGALLTLLAMYEFSASVSTPTVIAVIVAPAPFVILIRLLAAVVLLAEPELESFTHLVPSL